MAWVGTEAGGAWLEAVGLGGVPWGPCLVAGAVLSLFLAAPADSCPAGHPPP